MSSLDANFGIDTSSEGLANTAQQLANYLDPNDTHQAIAAIQNLPDGTVGAVESIVSTGKVDLTTAGPIIAAGLAATGVGAPAAAVVAAALPIASAIGNALGLFGGGKDEHYDYYVKSPGVTMAPADTNPNGYGRNGHIPYGPGDPAWQTADQFLPSGAENGFPANLYPPPSGYHAYYPSEEGNHNLDMLKAFPEWAMIKNDLTTLDRRPMSSNMRSFYRAYYGAWKANAEKLWNGHKGVAPSTLLAVVASAWNRSHSTATSETIRPASDMGQWPALSQTPDPALQASSLNAMYVKAGASAFLSAPTFIEALLGGLVDGADEPPLTLNMGAKAPTPKLAINLKLPPSAPPPKVAIGQDDMKTSPNVLAPAMFYVTGQKFAFNDPKLMPAVAAAKVTGVDPRRWAQLTDAQKQFVSLAGFSIAPRTGILDGLSRDVKQSSVDSEKSRLAIVAILGILAAIVGAYIIKKE